MKQCILWCLLVSILFGYVCLSQAADGKEPLFSSQALTITSTSGETGLRLEVTLADGQIEKVTPPPGIWPLRPRRDPDAEQKYADAIKELETLVKAYPTIKLSLCGLYLQVGRNQEAHACYEEAADMFAALNDMAMHALTLNQAAFFLWNIDQKKAAGQQAHHSFDVYRQQIRRLRQAEQNYQETLQVARDEDDQEQQLLTHQQLALVSYALGKDDESRKHAEVVLKLFEKIETPLMGKQRMDALIVEPIRELLKELSARAKDE
jgi:tetratricopeptide (TPR) repeat protein